MFTSQMVANGTAKAGQIAATFGVTQGTVKRYVAVYRQQGEKVFFAIPSEDLLSCRDGHGLPGAPGSGPHR